MSVVPRSPAPRSAALAALAALAAIAAFAAALAVSLGGSRQARADEPAPAPAPAPVAAPRTAEPPLSVDLSVPDVLRNLARITEVSITWSDQDKAVNTRKILGVGPIFRTSPDHLFDAVRALLVNDEILLVPYGPVAARMYRAMDARMLMSQFLVKGQPDVIEITDAMIPVLLGQGGRFVTTTIRVAHLTELRDARTALQRLITQNNVGSIQEVPATRAFIVTDFAPNVASIYRMVRQMDVPPVPAPTADAGRTAPSYFVLKHSVAKDVSHLLERLFPPKAASPTAPAPRPTPEAAVAVASGPAPRIWYDEATNQVIVIANADDAAAIGDIVRHVDVPLSK